MTFLELCQEVAEESGTIAGVPSFTTVSGATGRLKKLVRWVRNAYRDIQNERQDWLWMRKSFSHALVIGQSLYADTDLALSVAEWLSDTPRRQVMALYDPAIGISDEGGISQIAWETWRERYQRGSTDPNRPTEWAVTPQNQIAFGPTPDKAYILRGEYRAATQMLTLDADVPDMPARFHGIIVQEALRLMARSDEAFQTLGMNDLQYSRLEYPLVRDQTQPLYDISGIAIGR